MKEELLKVIERSYSPYSKFPVAALVITKDGRNYYGVNIENASYGATICAERVAIDNAIADGCKKGDFKTLVVMTKSDSLTFPCFLCRQVINEFFDKNAELVLMNDDDTKYYYMEDILTHPFGPEDLQ